MTSMPCNAMPTSTRSAAPARWWCDVAAAWGRWRTQARERAQIHRQLRALQGLSDRTLRDIGMAERMPLMRETLPMTDFDRGRW